MASVRTALSSGGFVGADLQSVPEHNAVVPGVLKRNNPMRNRREVEAKLKGLFVENFPANPFVFERVEFVGPVVGKKLLGKAFLAILFSFFRNRHLCGHSV